MGTLPKWIKRKFDDILYFFYDVNFSQQINDIDLFIIILKLIIFFKINIKKFKLLIDLYQ